MCEQLSAGDAGFCFPPTDGGVIAGAVVAALLVFALVAGLAYYLLRVRGYKPSLPTRASNHVDVVSV